MDTKNCIQWKNPKNKQWTLFDTDQGKIKGTSPEKFEGVPLAKAQAELELDYPENKKEAPELEGQDKGQDDSDSSVTFF